MRENADQNNSEYEHFLRSAYYRALVALVEPFRVIECIVTYLSNSPITRNKITTNLYHLLLFFIIILLKPLILRPCLYKAISRAIKGLIDFHWVLYEAIKTTKKIEPQSSFYDNNKQNVILEGDYMVLASHN